MTSRQSVHSPVKARHLSPGGAVAVRRRQLHAPGLPLRRYQRPQAERQPVLASAAATEPASTNTKLNTDGFHVHFGAGKLGLGLVFNAMVSSNVPFAIMQPPFPGDADALLNDKTVDVVINGESKISGGLTVITADNFADMKDSMKAGRSLVLIHPGPEWDEIVKEATSFSCSIGPKVCEIVGPIVEKDRLKLPKEMRPKLFACENDHDAVESLGELLKGKIEVIPCMVDRICSSRKVEPGKFEVGTEPWEGTIVPLTPIDLEDIRVPIPFGGSNVFIPQTVRESNYMYDRKIMTVNHMHTTLAFLSLVKYMNESGASPEDLVAGESACMSLPLIHFDPSLNPRENQIWCWAVAQVLLLISEHDRSTMLRSHNVSTDEELNKDLLDRIKQKLERFSAVEDSTARVLGAGVDTRYHGRLLPAYEAVKVLRDCMEQLPSDNRYQSLLDLAGVTMADVVGACEYLVTAAEPLATADREKYSLTKAEPDSFLVRFKNALDGWIEEESKTVSESISDDMQFLSRFKDIGLEWVACRLGDIGFREYRDWQNSVEGSYKRRLSKEEVENLENMDWMRSFEEKKVPKN